MAQQDFSLLLSALPGSESPAPAASQAPARSGDNVSNFVGTYLPLAQRVSEKTGVAPEALLGQWGLETGWGKSVIPGTNNLGNIKDFSGKGPKAVDNMTKSTDAYRAYETVDDFGDDFAGLLSRRYRTALNAGGDTQKYFNELKRLGYAEDPNYVASGVKAAKMVSNVLGTSAGQAPSFSNARPLTTDRSMGEALADNLLGAASGVVTGAKLLTDTFGADNRVSQALGDTTKALTDSQSQYRKDQRQERAFEIKNAEASGSTWNEIVANIGGFLEAPVETTLNALGTSAPTLLMAVIPGLGQAQAARFILQGAAGAAQGVGAAKSGIYDAVRNELEATGKYTADEAAKIAAGAQAYDSENAGNIAINGLLGLVAGTSGIESVAGRLAGRKVGQETARGIAGRAGMGVAKESPVEGAQGGFERYTSNVALQNEGFDVDPMQGVAGQAAGEAIASAPGGAAFGALDRGVTPPPAPNPLQSVVDQAQKPGSVLSRAVVSTGVTDQPVVPVENTIVPGQETVAGAQTQIGVDQTQIGNTSNPTGPGPSADPFARKAAELEQVIRSQDLIRSIRTDGAGLNGVMFDLRTLRDPSAREDIKQAAQQRIEEEITWAQTNYRPKPEMDTVQGTPGFEPIDPARQPEPRGQDVMGLDIVRATLRDPQIGPKVSDTDRQEILRFSADAQNPGLPLQTRQQAAQQAIELVGRYRAAMEPQVQPAADSASPEEQQTVVDQTAPVADETTARTPAGAGPALFRRRAETIGQLVANGFETVQRRPDGFFLTNTKTGQEFKLDSMADAQIARNQIQKAVDAKANTAAASPLNDLAEPTQAQIEAGNYKKSDVIDLNGMKIKIENPKGSVRRGTSPDGVMWETKMAHHYGEFQGTVGADGDKLDVFVGPRPDGDKVYVIDQVNEDGSFDEHKVMMGFTSEEAARAGYLANYEKGWTGLGAITEMPVADFKTWAKSRQAKKPAASMAKPAAAAPVAETAAAPAATPAAPSTQGQFATADEAKAYISQQRRTNGNVSGLPLQMADGTFGIAIKGTPQYAEAERQRDERDAQAAKSQGEFFTVPDGGKQKKLKRVKKSAMPKKASPRRMGEPRALTQDEASMIEQVAAVLGKNVVFFEAQGDRIGDGFILPNDPSTLYVATETTVNPLAVFGHEFFHGLRETNPEAWNAIAAVVRTRVADPKGFREDYYRGGDDSQLSEEKGGELEELVSDLGGNLMMDPTFWRDVFAKIGEDHGKDAKGIIARLAAAIESLIARVMKAMAQPGFRANDFVSDIESIRNAYKDGLADFIKAAGVNKASMGAEVAKAKQGLLKTPDRAAQPGSLTVEGYHFSQQPRAVLTTGLFGTGLNGSARDEIMNADDQRLRQRLSFYVNKGTGINPEAGVGAYAHKATLTNIYDSDADPLRLRTGDARAFESKVLDAGFSGYLARMDGTQSGNVVLLGNQTVKPELLGTGPVKGAKVVPAPQQRDQDTADRLMASKDLPAGMLSPQRWSEVLIAQDPELAAQLLDIGAFEGSKGMYKDELAAKVRSLGGQIRKSADRAKSEYDAVVAQYKGTDAWMKAPNGEATKLSERQWVQVRTPSFKKWFGDWEAALAKGGVWAVEDVSKAVGENGEPLVVYHGSDKGGFTEFEAPGGSGRGDLGIWTTPDYGMAKSYVRKGRARDVDLSTPSQSELEDAGYEFFGLTDDDTESPGQYYDEPNGDRNGPFETEQEAVADAATSFEGEAGVQPGIYALFINIRNPNESNFEGAMWNGERIDQFQVRDENDEPVYDKDGRGYFDRDTAEALVEANPGAEMQPADPNFETTDDVVREALRNDNDGAIIREVIDDGGGPGYFLDPQDIFVAFDPSQVKSADYNNGEFSDSTGDLRKSADRKSLKREDPFEMSTRIPTAKGKAVEDHMGDLLISDFGSGKSQERWINTVSGIVTQYPNYREADSAKTPEKKLERLIRQMTDNLVWLHNQVPASTRKRSKLWYDGANAIAERMAKRYGITEPQAAGILAVLSPQKDWFMNVSLADRVASIMAERQKFAWSPQMEATSKRIYGGAQYQVALDQVRGKTLGGLDDDYLASIWLRVYDQTYNSRSFDIVSPEGDMLARAQTKKGVDANVAWGGNSTIAKAIAVFRDGGVGRISSELGTKHKVRNFYNNILVPNSRNGHVTIDTHAVAAALLRPLSGNSLEVKHNFGGASNAISGLQGTYALYEEAYRRAAKELGLLPRELQSITWEAIRGMYVPGFKSQQKNVDGIDKIWTQFKKGRLSYDGARELAIETAGGIEAPSWLGRNPGVYVEEQLAAESDDVSGDGVSGGSSEDIVIRAVGDDSGAPEAGIRRSGDRDGAGLDSSGSRSQGEGAQDGAGRLAPLPGYAHGNIQGAAGPDPRIVEVAEKYARDNGITLVRQAEYVEVDPERAARIADAYQAMPHAPQDPRVKEAFRNLISQTRAQYDALIEAGYEFTFFDSNSDPYQGNPWSAMRDLRANKRMAVYGTYDGYGTEGITAKAADDNPMLGDTGLQWKDQGGQLRPVAANDLFRAVHDAFGHGLEGAGFRAQGEENAWQAHVRLFTGSAVGAITSETRGQNSWLNYGPYGETNRTAKLEGTVFAEQKTGLMPEWTWSEGVAADAGDIRKSPARRNDLMAAKLSRVGIKSADDFWRTWRNLMVGTAGPDPRLSAIGSTDSQVQRVEGLVRAHRIDADDSGILSVLKGYDTKPEGAKTGGNEDGVVTSAIAKRILESAGVKPTVENAVAAYESLPGSAQQNVVDATYNQRIAALKDLISCLKK
jgi:hypothetical protein